MEITRSTIDQVKEDVQENKTIKPPLTAAATLRELIAKKDSILVCPGVYDGLTARIALQAGFDCLYMTGAGTTMSRLGMPDLGVATLNDMRENAAMIAGLDQKVPLIADADTGFGGPLMVGRTVTQYMAAGVASLHLEDQVVNKRCGHLKNKELVDEEEYLSRIRAAVMAREQTPGDIVLIARSDGLESLGYKSSVARLKRAIALGADVAFLEGIKSKDQAMRVCSDLAPTPVLLNMVHGGVTPKLSAAEAKEMGFKIIIFPGFALKAVYTGVAAAAKELKETGDMAFESTNNGSPQDIFNVCGLKECTQFDMAAGGKNYSKGV